MPKYRFSHDESILKVLRQAELDGDIKTGEGLTGWAIGMACGKSRNESSNWARPALRSLYDEALVDKIHSGQNDIWLLTIAGWETADRLLQQVTMAQVLSK